MKDTKMIRVTSRGYVTTSRGRVISPIMSPYRESISRIWSMITTDRADVEEKLPDGSFVKLTAQNFDKDNFVSEEVKQVEKPELKDPVETFKNTDGENKAPEEKKEENTNKQEQVETPVQNNAESGNNSDEVDEEPAKDKNTEAPVEGENKAPEEDSNKQEQVETPVQNNNQNNDPRYNKKNKNKNRNNNQNANKQSVEVTAEPVQ